MTNKITVGSTVFGPVNDKPLWNGCREAGKNQDRKGPNFNTSVVVHTTENKLGGKALSVAKWQNRIKNRFSGYHYLIDAGGFYEFGDPDTFRANHAGRSEIVPPRTAGASNDIGISLVAFAKNWRRNRKTNQRKVDAIIEQAARCCAYLHLRYDIPLVEITRQEYKAGKHGFLGHEDVATHPTTRKSDPGERTGFPWRKMLDRAIELVESADPSKAPSVKQSQEVANLQDDFYAELYGKLSSYIKPFKPSSVFYSVRFYRALAKAVEVNGSKPEDVVKALIERLGK